MRTKHVLEIQDEKRREKAKGALFILWDVMGLSQGGGIKLPGDFTKEQIEAYWHAYHLVGDLLLGPDCPEKEILT
jgi:hypothetical protein